MAECSLQPAACRSLENHVITLTCDKCDKPFEIEDDAAGEKVECPYCGDINRVPSKTGPEQSEAPDRRTGKPVTTKPITQEPEQNIVIVRQAMFRAHPFWYTLMALVFLGGIVLAVSAKTTAALANAPWLSWVGLGMIAVGGLWWLIWWAAPHRWIKLTITNKRTIRQEGIIVRRTSEVLHDHIRNVKIEQSFLQRLLGVGSISIDSAGGSETQLVEIEMKHIAHPYRVKQILDRYRRM